LKQTTDTDDKTGRGPATGHVSTQDIREKLEELGDAAIETGKREGAAWIVGGLLGAAAAITVAYLAGRRSCG
jgi:hypothetical protein